jgi:hypothetical protein
MLRILINIYIRYILNFRFLTKFIKNQEKVDFLLT